MKSQLPSECTLAERTSAELTSAERTLAFYDRNAGPFIDGTRNLAMEGLYERFLPHVPEGGHILDAGCGSGRDALEFLRRGYQVTAFDGSPEVVRRSTEITGLSILNLRFDEMSWQGAFDGIWACASLLHVPSVELPTVLQRFQRALKPEGMLYASFKKGRGEHWRGERYFVDLDIGDAHTLVKQLDGWHLTDAWETSDVRPERSGDQWINLLLRATTNSARSEGDC